MSLQALIEKFKQAREKANQHYDSENFNSTLLISGLTGDFAYEMHKGDRDFISLSANEILKLIEACEVMQDALLIYEQQRAWLSPTQVLERADDICKGVTNE